jgi:hypothetical protein
VVEKITPHPSPLPEGERGREREEGVVKSLSNRRIKSIRFFLEVQKKMKSPLRWNGSVRFFA